MATISLFKHRNLALGCTAFLFTLFLCYHISVTLMLLLGAVCVICAICIWLAYSKTRSKKIFNIAIMLTPTLALTILAIILSLFTFVSDRDYYSYCDNNPHIVEGSVESVVYEAPYFTLYTATISNIDAVPCNIRAVLSDEGAFISDDASFTGTVTLHKLENQEIGFDTANYYLDNGILLGGEISEYAEIRKSSKGDNFFSRANSFLDSILENNLNYEAYPIASALLLGNRHQLPDKLTRDFSRLGIVHILSLSGMHVAIIVTILGFLISKTNISKISQIAIMVTFITLFVGISGFSEPAVRAGIMQFIVYFVSILWSTADTISSLFVSVTLICIYSPYFIFSLSLMLSFLSMLGCIASSKLLYKSKLIYRVKFRFIRFIILTSVTTIGVTLITLPLTFIYFGQISLVAIPANIVLVPILNILIYLVPLVIFFSFMPSIADFIAFMCEEICSLVIQVLDYFSEIKNISYAITGDIQYIGAIVIFVACMLVIILSKKRLKYTLSLVCVGVIIFVVGLIVVHTSRNNYIYMTAYSDNQNDTICIERNNALTVIDISDYPQGNVFPYSMSSYLGYSEVECYISMSYSHRLDAYLDKMTDTVVVRSIYLPSPKNQLEEEYLSRCALLLRGKGIDFCLFDNELIIDNMKISVCPDMFIGDSTTRSVVFSVSFDTFNYTYMGASAFEIVSTLTDMYAFCADVLVLGSYGPEYNTKFKYNLPNCESIIFIGGSASFANEDFLIKHKDKCFFYEPYKIRINN